MNSSNESEQSSGKKRWETRKKNQQIKAQMYAEANNLPALTGSEKQVTWANWLRHQWMTYPELNAQESLWSLLKQKTLASWWIRISGEYGDPLEYKRRMLEVDPRFVFELQFADVENNNKENPNDPSDTTNH